MGLFSFMAIAFVAYWIYVLFFASKETLDAWGEQVAAKKRERAALRAADEGKQSARVDRRRTADTTGSDSNPSAETPDSTASSSDDFDGGGGSFGGGGADGEW